MISLLTEEVEGLDVAVHDALGVEVHDARAALLGHAQLDGLGQEVAEGMHARGDARQQHAGDAVTIAQPADAVVRTAAGKGLRRTTCI